MSGIVSILNKYYGYIEELGYAVFCIKGAITILKDLNNSNLESGIQTLMATGGKFAIFCSLPNILLQIKELC